MVKALTQVLRNLCSHADDMNVREEVGQKVSKKKSKGMPPPFSSQHLVLQHDLLPMILAALDTLTEYDVHVNLYQAIGTLLISPHLDVVPTTVKKGCLN